MDRSDLAEVLRLFADALDQPLPQATLIPQAAPPAPPAPPAPRQPVKLKAPEGALFTSGPDWRQFIIQLEQQLRERFGTEPIYMRRLRNFLEEHVELLPGDLKECHSVTNKSPRWFGNLQSAINCDPSYWPLGRPVIVPAGHRGYYRLA